MSDFEWERKKLWADVLWEVEEAAQACGFSVTLVDMYLGAEHDAVYDRHTLDEFLQEIAHAHHESAGPFFLVGTLTKVMKSLTTLASTNTMNFKTFFSLDSSKVYLFFWWFHSAEIFNP